MKSMKDQFDKGKRRKGNLAYIRHSNKIYRLRKKGDRLKGKENTAATLQTIQKDIKEIQHQRRRLPSSDPFYEGYKRLYYCRYADDYVISIIGSKADAQRHSARGQAVHPRDTQAGDSRRKVSYPAQ